MTYWRLVIAITLFVWIVSGAYHDNWAVLLCTSRFYFNYRHLVNTLAVYHTIRKAGFPQERIIFMNAEEDVTCDNRNPLSGVLKSNIGVDFFRNFSEIVEIDYKGSDVSIDNFLNVLIGRHSPEVPLSQRLQSGPDSNVFIYMTGHGGDEFFKFQDTAELAAQELAYAIDEMYDKVRYKEILIVLDTCQASTMCTYIRSPNVHCIGSSQRDENSYAYIPDDDVGIPVMDRFTFAFVNILLQRQTQSTLSSMSIEKLVRSIDPNFIRSTPSISSSPLSNHPNKVDVNDFFAYPLRSKLINFQKHIQKPFSGDDPIESLEHTVCESCESIPKKIFLDDDKEADLNADDKDKNSTNVVSVSTSSEL